MKNIVVIALLVLSLGFVVAHDNSYKVFYGHDSSPIRDDPAGPGEPEKFSNTYYFDGDLKVVSNIYILADYSTLSGHTLDRAREPLRGKNLKAGNYKRFSTMDYRHGYSYRSSGDYFKERYSDVIHKKSYSFVSVERGNFRNYHDKHFDSGVRYSYKYVPHLRSYEKRECYVNPPKDKLFYVKC